MFFDRWRDPQFPFWFSTPLPTHFQPIETRMRPKLPEQLSLKQHIMAGKKPTRPHSTDALELFHPVTAALFRAVFEQPTAPQRLGWPPIARGENTLILAPTGTGKTLTAFLWCLNRLMLHRAADETEGCRVIYLSPLKALAVDVERNLRSPLAGSANMAP